MAKHYKRPVMRRKSNRLTLFLGIGISFAVGFFMGGGSLDMPQFNHWFNQNGHPQTAVTATKEPPPIQQAVLPKPKLEFYTLLAKEPMAMAPVATASAVKTATVPPAVAAVATTEASNLANKKPSEPISPVTSSALVTPVTALKKPPVTHPVTQVVSKESYTVQVAAFKTKQDAEHLKASLVLKGFPVVIATIAPPQGTWYRVMIGPFSSRQDAEKAQMTVAKTEHVTGMVRKMGA